MSPFDAAIKILRKYIGGDPDSLNSELASAIRLLEAAGKVDNIQRAIQLMKHSSALRYCKVIRLLEALPDKEPKP